MKLLPPLGVVLAIVLVAAAVMLWLNEGSADSESIGRLLTTTQAARADAKAAFSGSPESVARLQQAERDIARLRALAAPMPGSAAAGILSDAAAWQSLDASLATILSTSGALTDFQVQRAELLMLAPELLAATGNLMGVLTPTELRANQAYLERFELTVQTIQQNARSLEVPGSAADALRSLGDAEQFLAQIMRGLSGEDSGLGLTSVTGPAAAENLESATALFEQARSAIDAMAAAEDQVAAAEAAILQLDSAAAGLFEQYRSVSDNVATASVTDRRAPLYLVGAAIVVVFLMMIAYYRARDFRRAAQLQAQQNERNQEAILRLLDELSSLADGDLTVQATVTEDITGAIADSINYAIEALRELVATVNDSSILVDAAAKQTEATSRHLVRSAETQMKQAAAASDSTSKMATSIEEVSGNAERCSDVARHAVDVAHKGGEAVRRTIEGMNTIRETIQDTSKRIKRLGESSQEIGNIVELIEEIAEQTNILALNASIEASRAGEASRGFAVVADEVQKLAERSTSATRKIEVLVSTIQSDTNEAVVSMERSTTDVVGGALLAENAGAALDEIEQVSHQIASLVQNISGSARDQSRVSAAINKNMQVLRQISSKTTQSTAATSSAISKLSELASQLRRTVRGFTLPDQGAATGILSQVQVADGLKQESDLEVDVALQDVQRRRLSG